MFGSQARPGMRGPLGGCHCAKGSTLSGSSLAGNILAGDTLGAQIYNIEPMHGDETATSLAQDKLTAYGRKVAATLMSTISRLPAAQRAEAMRQAMNKLDPNLYDRARRYGEANKLTGMDAKSALQAGIAKAVVEGFMGQLHTLGTKGTPALSGLGLICGVIPQGAEEDLGLWPFSQIASAVSGGASPVTSAIASGASATHVSGLGSGIFGVVSSAVNAVKSLTCTLVNSGGAQAAAQVAGSTPSAASVGVAAGAMVAGQVCGGAAPQTGPSYVEPPSKLPIYLAVGGAGVLLAVALLKRRK